MRHLVISDIHDKVDAARRIIDGVPHDRLIFLGDFFDDFSTGAREARETARFARECLRDPNADVLLGNHDLHYGWHQVRDHRCSGFTLAKCDAINAELAWEDWKLFKLRLWIECRRRPLLITHAGFDWHFLPDGCDLKTVVDDRCEIALRSLHGPVPHERGKGESILAAGIDRSGRQHKGGILWCDWHNLEMPSGADQLVGHTPSREPRVHEGDRAIGVCLDTHLKHCGIIEDGLLTVSRTDSSKISTSLPYLVRG